MTPSAHKTEGKNRTKTVRLYPIVFTSTDEGGIAAYYNYSADGDLCGSRAQSRACSSYAEMKQSVHSKRNIKLTSPRLNIQQNATLFSNPPLVYPTLYASSLVTLTKHGYTNVTEVESRASSLALPRCSNVTEGKHYFEEGRRICSKIGSGMHGNVTVEEIDSRVGELASSYDEQYHTQSEGIRQTFHDCIEANPQIIDGVNLHRMLIDRELRHDEDEPAFFYHSDHLGSAAYLTLRGQVYQTLNYLPYGEDWVERNYFAPHDTTRLSIYRFNGKEKDYESGFHYYGARYYWSEILTGWLSVDPMIDKYPSISPYAYCAWNPVTVIDPDGRDWYRNDETGSVLWSDNNDKKIDYNGESYRNIGKSYSRYVDGMRINYGNSPDDFSIEEADPNLNIEGGQYIPKEFTTDDGSVVSVSFNKGADNSIDTKTVSALIKSVNEANNSGANISSLHISSTSNHTSNQSKSAHSHHNGSRAIDISMINNSAVNTSNPRAKSLQNAIKSTPGWLENYGPFIIEKMNNGKAIQAPWARTCCADGHTRHIHISTPK